MASGRGPSENVHRTGVVGAENDKVHLVGLRALKQTLKQLALSVRILRVRGKVT